MKKSTNILCSICHRAIKTRHVFTKNNQVYLKGSVQDIEQTSSESIEWYPINFQWMPIVQLNTILKV